MYGGMGKLGRGGGGRGGGKRSLPPHPPPAHIQRVGPSAAGSRLPLGPPSAASRGRHSGVTPGPGGVAAAAEETFSMVSADALDFAAIIRLTPDLVDEIRRIEAQGGAAKIKFDSNANNLSGNVIDVGGKEFKFTWSRELGVCDIYEELQTGEDGNGLLSECGSAWRKLNVQRILDESLKNQVKMRSEEAERRLKSRKSIVLDPANPSVKNQAKTMAAAAVEGNMRRMHWKKDQVFKKRKSEPVPNTNGPRSAFKSGLPSSTHSGTMLSISPQRSPPEQAGVGASVSPFGMTNFLRGHATVDEDLPSLTSNGEDVMNSEKELPNKPAHGATRRLVGNKGASSSQPADLRSLLVNLLLETPKGMSLKALEKAVGEVIPNSGKKIESIIKTIAIYQAPGRYILKPKVEAECPRRPPSENGSSPEHPLGTLPVTKAVERDNNEDSEQKTQLTRKPVESEIIERIDIEQNSPDRPTTDKKADNEDEGVCSSSESGSDSDSESNSSESGSDSGSQSRSRSKSQSPVGSASASSSDSESDGSSSSKEGSDVDVDIMTSDDDKEQTGNKVPRSPRLSPSPGERKAYDEKCEENVIGKGNLDFRRGDDACAVENTEGRFKESKTKTSENYESAATMAVVSDDFQMDVQILGDQQPVLQSTPSAGKSIDKSEHVMSHISTDKQYIMDCLDLKQSDGTEMIPKAKFKRASDSKHHQGKPESSKRLRAVKTGVQVASEKSGESRDNSFPEKACSISPDRPDMVQHRGQMMLNTSDTDQDRSTFDSQKDPDSARAGRYIVRGIADGPKLNLDLQNVNGTVSDVQQSGQRAGDSTVRRKAFDGAEKSGKHIDNSRACRHPEKSYGRADEIDKSGTRSISVQDKFSMSKDKLHKDVRDVNMDINGKYSDRNLLDDAGGDKMLSFPPSHYWRPSDQNGIQKDTKLSLNMHKADVDKSAITSDKGVPLRRELSDLELGEFREPPSNDDTKEGRRPFERKGSFKSLESKLNVMDNFSSDSNKGRTAAKTVHDSKRESPSVSKCGSQANQDGSYRRMSEGDMTESTFPQQRTVSSQVQQFQRIDRSEHDPVPHLDRLSDMAGRGETRTSQGIVQENLVGSHKRASVSVLPHHDTKHNGHNGHMACKAAMDTTPQKYNGRSNMSDQCKESFQVESVTSSGKRMDSSSDEDNPFYAKYDKNEPELRGPVKDYLQYKEYVQEYCEKYDCYSSLDRHLENYRNEFLKIGRDLEFYKGRDKEAYHNISEQIIQLYHQCRKKHSRMKKIFIILHDELKILKQRMLEFAEGCTKD